MRCRELGTTLEMVSDGVWRVRGLARAHYIRVEYDGDFRRVALMPVLAEQDGGEAAAAWLRTTLTRALGEDGLTLRFDDPVSASGKPDQGSASLLDARLVPPR